MALFERCSLRGCWLAVVRSYFCNNKGIWVEADQPEEGEPEKVSKCKICGHGPQKHSALAVSFLYSEGSIV